MSVKIPDRTLVYFSLVTIVLVLGVVLVLCLSAATHPGLVRDNMSELNRYYPYHQSFVIPHMATVFPRLFLSNTGVALFILLVPLYWAWIWWLNPKLLTTVIRLMQATVLLLVLALGHNSFSYAYITFSRFPPAVFLAMYVPHGWLEMLAFILAGTFSLVCIDALKEYLAGHREACGLHPGGIALFIIHRVWRVFLLIAILLAVAAAIECWVTPHLVTMVLEQALPPASWIGESSL